MSTRSSACPPGEAKPSRWRRCELVDARERASRVGRPVSVGNDRDDVEPGDAYPLVEGPDRVGEMLDHVGGEDEVVRVVGERQFVARSHDVDAGRISRKSPLELLVLGLLAGVAIDVDRVEVEAIVARSADLDTLQAAEVAAHKPRATVADQIPADAYPEHAVEDRVLEPRRQSPLGTLRDELFQAQQKAAHVRRILSGFGMRTCIWQEDDLIAGSVVGMALARLALVNMGAGDAAARAGPMSSQRAAADPTELLDSSLAGPAATRGGARRAGGYLVGVLVSVVSAALLFRHLGVIDTGRYVLALSLVAIIGALSDLGLTAVGVREIARLPEPERWPLAQALLGRRISLTLIGGVVVTAITALVYTPMLAAGVAMASVGLLLQAAQDNFSMPLVVDLRLGGVAAVQLLRQVLSTIAILLLVFAGAGMLSFLAVSIPVGLVVLAVTIQIVRGRRSLMPSFDLNGGAGCCRRSFPTPWRWPPRFFTSGWRSSSSRCSQRTPERLLQRVVSHR